jgi:DNA-binding transcriptional MerR regulator/methylmalonyl-CoA mutase cobalamin-binding subunit
MNPGYPIKVVAQRTGLTPHTIRAWERRYAALAPERTATNRRLYTDTDIQKLLLLSQAVQAGNSIGQIARLTLPELQTLVAQDGRSRNSPFQSDASQTEPPGTAPYLGECLDAAERLDAGALEDVLTHAAMALGAVALINQVILPLLKTMDDLRFKGKVRTAHENLVTAVLRTYLGRMVTSFPGSSPAPHLIVTTPAGQMHELGALLVAVIGAFEGWRVTYLGPNLPAEEIAGAAHQQGARAVALSIVHPPDDPGLVRELFTLRKCLGEEIVILVGGRAAGAYIHALQATEAVVLGDIASLRAELAAMRSRSSHP